MVGQLNPFKTKKNSNPVRTLGFGERIRLESKTRRIGFCIWCGGAGETDDHIVPLALGGKHILRDSSCEQCRNRLNQNVDQPVLRGLLSLPRAAYQVPRSNKREPEKVLKYRTSPGDHVPDRVQKIERQSVPRVMNALLHPPPSLLSDEGPSPYGDGMPVAGIWLHAEVPEEAAVFLAAENSPVSSQNDYRLFIRMMAKIAYSWACFELGADGFTPLILDVIEGKDEDIFRLCGNCNNHAEVDREDWYTLSLRHEAHFVIASVRVFASFGMPTYDVVVGTSRSLGG